MVWFQQYLCTLITLLRVPYLGRIGSTKLVLPKWHKYGILNRVIRVWEYVYFTNYFTQLCIRWSVLSEVCSKDTYHETNSLNAGLWQQLQEISSLGQVYNDHQDLGLYNRAGTNMKNLSQKWKICPRNEKSLSEFKLIVWSFATLHTHMETCVVMTINI